MSSLIHKFSGNIRDSQFVPPVSSEQSKLNKNKLSKWLMIIPISLTAGLLYILFSLNFKKGPVTHTSTVVHSNNLENASNTQEHSSKKTEGVYFHKTNTHASEVVEKRLQAFPKLWQDMFKEQMDLNLVNELEKCKTLEEAVIILSKDLDPSFNEIELQSWLSNTSRQINSYTWGGLKFHELSPKDQLCALATYLIKQDDFKYGETVSPDLYNINNVLKRKEGYCATLPVIFALVCERLRLPVHIVQGAQHLFNRYDDGKVQINIETTNPVAMGVGTPDEFYMKDEERGLHIPKTFLKTTSTMKSLNLRQSISVLLINNMAALSDVGSLSEFATGSIPKKGNKLALLSNYMFASLYFDRHNAMPIINTLKAMNSKPEYFANQHFYSSLRGYAVRKGIQPVTKEDLKFLYRQMETFLIDFENVNKNKLLELNKQKSELEESTLKEIAALNKQIENNRRSINKFIKANYYVLPEDTKEKLNSVLKSYNELKPLLKKTNN